MRYAVSYRDIEEILAERGVTVDHATLNRWVVKFSPLIAARMQVKKRPTARSWRADETYIKVKGRWTYLYRAVDRDGQTLDFCCLSAAIWQLPGGFSNAQSRRTERLSAL